MDYKVKKLDIKNNDIRSEVTGLVNITYNLKLPQEKLLLNTNTRNGKSLYLGVYKGEELVAVNFFISHELLYNNKTVNAHQSCWSTTSIKHRKRGLFSLLINTAKEILNESGSAFIFGFPNVNSEGIFVNNLGFKRLGMCKLNIPGRIFPKLALKYFLKSDNKKDLFKTENCFIPVESEIIDLKLQEYLDEIRVYGNYNNLIWGRRNTRASKFGKFDFFNVGGIQVNKPHLLNLVFNDIFQKEKVDFIQIVGVEINTVWNLFRNVKFASNTEPLIVYNLNESVGDSHINFLTGIKDVF